VVKWRKLERSQNVQDRRGMGGRAAVGIGGLGIVGVIIALLFGGGGSGGAFNDLLNELGQAPPAQSGQQPEEFQGLDDDELFVSSILGSTETLWEDIFRSAGRTYQPAQLVLFTDATTSACGGAVEQVGPHYCPRDETIYVDLDFFALLRQRFGASTGDFAQAYVIAHEVAHHVQQELGIMDEMRRLQQQNPGDANSLSVSLELQADCLAGVWAHSIFTRGDVLEAGDIDEALSAAAAVGDDNIQRQTAGRVSPESWTHGSSEQRVEWFTTGYETGDPDRCSTF
jgi:predicted metalloprotease